MRTLSDFINESLNENDVRSEIEQFLNEYYTFDSVKISKNVNKDGMYELTAVGDVEVSDMRIKSLTNGTFVWKSVKGSFICSFCTELTSLEGAPEIVDDVFSCENAINLKSLNGAPKKVGRDFICSGCKSLVDLKGAPKSVPNGMFLCDYCFSLKSLNGAPKTVGSDFRCHNCVSLKSLKDAPKTVGEDFTCFDCGTTFTEEDVDKICNVGGFVSC